MARNSRDGRRKSPETFCCVTTHKAPQACPWRQAHCPVAFGAETPVVFAVGVPPPCAAGVPRVGTGTSVAASPPANVAPPAGTLDLGSTVGYIAAPETSGRTPSANSFATPAAPYWSRHPCLS